MVLPLQPKTSLPVVAGTREEQQTSTRLQELEQRVQELSEAYRQLRSLTLQLVENLDHRQFITLRLLNDICSGSVQLREGALTGIDLEWYYGQLNWVFVLMSGLERFKEMATPPPPAEEEMIMFGGD